MSKTRTQSPHSGPTDLPSWSWAWNASAEDLEAMFATDDDGVDTAVIPHLAYRDAVEEAATPGAAATTSTKQPAKAAPAPKAAPEAKATPTPKAAPEAKATPTRESAPTQEAAPEASTQSQSLPVGHSLRSRHATPESRAAVRRNLIAVCCVAVSVVLVGLATGLVGGWIALATYTLLVVVAAFVLSRINARYAPRHSRYSARHA